MTQRNIMEGNPYDWRADQHSIPLRKKILKAIRYNLTADKTILIKCRMMFRTFKAMFGKRVCFFIGTDHVSFEWRDFKLHKMVIRDFVFRDEYGNALDNSYEETAFYSKYPWHKYWTPGLVVRDEWQDVDFIDDAYEQYLLDGADAHMGGAVYE